MHESIHPKSMTTLDTQKMIIKEILDERRRKGEIKSDSEYQAEWKAYMDKLERSKTFMTPRKQEGITDSKSHNETFSEVEVDLRSVYAQVQEIGETTKKHKRLNQSTLNNLKLRLKRIDNDLARHERLIDTPDVGAIHYETFIDSNSFEADYTYYTERNGRQVPAEYHARWDIEAEAVKLPLAASDNGLIGAGGTKLGTLVIRKQLGSTMSELRNPIHDTDKAIDTNPESYWSETVMMDAPIRVDMGSEYYGVKFGALVELDMQFDYLTPMNEIGFHAFGEYPMDIVAIQYYESDNEEEEPKELVFPGSPVSDLKSRSFDGSLVFQFPDLSAKRLRIILNQRHYVKKDIIVSEKEQRNMRLWISAHKEDSVQELQVDELDVEHILEKIDEDEHHVVTKFEYQYGLYSLSVKRNEYHNAGIYVSRMIPVSQNVKAVRIEALEKHPEHAYPLRLTDVEFYVHDGRQWYPIMPFTQDKVHSELLFPEFSQGQYRAKTRFKVKEGAVIRKNGIQVGKVTLLDDENILFGEYDASAYYTIEYVPADESWTIDFLEKYKDESGEVKPNVITEEIMGTDSKGAVTLKYPPFVDKSKMNVQPENYDPSYLENEYVPIVVKLIDKNGYSILQPMNEKEADISIRNVSDYGQTGQSRLKPFGVESPVYQYEVVGNQVQFNAVIPESTRIIIEYPYLVSHVRVKAILRRNIPGFHGITPVLEDYIAHFQTLI